MHWRWTSGVLSENRKTGKIPTAYPGDKAAAWESCEGCPLRTRGRPKIDNRFVVDPQHPTCYFWSGHGHGVIRTLATAEKRGTDYSLSAALANRLVSAKAARMSGGGDPSATDPTGYLAMERAVRAEGLAWLDYTHFWESRGAWLKGHAMASCDTWEQAVDAVAQGWRAAVHVPVVEGKRGVVDGVDWLLCPAQRTRPLTCNQCRLCDAGRVKRPSIIVFRNH